MLNGHTAFVRECDKQRDRHGYFFYYYDEFKQDWSFAKENQLLNVENTMNSFSFDTNYAAQKIICLNVPYDQGWTLTVDDEETDIIMMNGGFIGFVGWL